MVSAETLQVLGNEYNPEILEATDEPRSAQELSEELDIPIATCYRRIDELEDVDLLELYDQPLSDAHRRINVYRRNVDEIRAEFNGQDLIVQVTERAEVKNKLDDVWRTLSESI